MALFLGTTVLVFAENTQSEVDDYELKRALFTAEALGIDSTGYENSKEVTRGDSVRFIAELLFGKDIALDATGSIFHDVFSNHRNAKPIELMAKLGIINGYGDGNFLPEKSLKGIEAIKILTAALGYQIVAENEGGYQSGYLTMASELGILKHFDEISGSVSFGTFMKLWYRFANCKPLIVDGIVGEIYKAGDSSILENALDREDLYLLKGVVTGNSYGSVAADNFGDLEIEGVSYYCGDKDYDKYLGFSIEAYIKKEGTKDTVIAVMSAKKNHLVSIDSGDISKISLTAVTYFDEDDIETVDFSTIPFFVKNGKILSSPSNEEIAPLNGTVLLIDNDDDDEYEYVSIESKEYFSIDRISQENNVIYLKSGQYYGKNAIYIDPSNDKYRHEIRDEAGNEISFSELDSGMYFSISGSEDHRKAVLNVLSDTLEGTVSSISDEEWGLTIDGTEYRVADTREGSKCFDKNELNFSYAYRFYLDGRTIIDYEEIQSFDVYGLVIGTMKKTQISGEVLYKIVSGDKNIYIGSLAEKVRYNGKSIKKEAIPDLSGRLVTYKTDENGKIIELNEAETFEEKESRRFISKSNAFVSLNYRVPVFMSNETQVFVLPNSGEEEDYKSSIKLLDNEKYTIQAFDYDEETKLVSAIVIYADSYYDTAGILNSDSPVVIFDKAVMVLDEYGDSVYKLFWIEGGEKSEATVKSTTTLDNIISGMKNGDVFRYSQNSINQVDNIEVLCEPEMAPFHTGAGTIKELAYGTVVEAYANEAPKGTIGQLTNMITLNIDGQEKSFLLTSDDPIHYYLYNSKRNEVKPAVFDDIITDGVFGETSASKVFIYTVLNETRTVVIMK